MGFRYSRRAKLFGGVGLNVSKSGISPSIRTPFGTVSSKGVSIRTGIKGLSFRISNSPKPEAGKLFRAEYDITYQKSMEFVSRIERIKRFNGKEMGYRMPNSNYNAMLSELEPLIELGMEIDAELVELQGITRQYRLGMMPDMNSLRKELAKLMSELETVWNALYQNKQQYIAENAVPVIAQPPPLDIGYFGEYQPLAPSVKSVPEPPSDEKGRQSSNGFGTLHNLKETLTLIVSVLAVGVLLFTVSIKARHGDAAKASVEKQAEAEHQQKVDAVAERVAEAQGKRDAAPIAETTNKQFIDAVAKMVAEAQAKNKKDAPSAETTDKQFIDAINSFSERYEMPTADVLRWQYVGSRLGFTLRDYGQWLDNMEENANAVTGGERKRNLSRMPKKVYPKLSIDAQLPEQDPVLTKFEKAMGETIQSLKAEHRLY